ncbi:SDR family oxidoreductase [Parapedobacter koreensis]|uniref:NAD(P)-dependent dehydrogenase, short-chain alcohol dehydrogenase family n=1 Tax=Parapedobacter koreensis TaxID=332977 RepID=A0A1H7LQB6_9SPHI|nr:SDR family oxidoreductase [Parapedobacter koreensis]SEL01172.1 NAD(P)-dependent dehydrogenase, short-chain alcohol dehydrogenase family [Parapedobacter koreensis]
MDFTNKNVVITGGSTGIGFSTAKAFINAGANVWITGRSADNLQKAATEINNPKLKTVVSDTSNLAGITVLEKAIAESERKLDVLFLNAGIASFAPIEQQTESDFDAQFSTNVKGPYFALQKLLPHLNNGASVLFTSSTVATASTIGTSAYSATKGALNKIAQIAANELAERKIRVNIVSPGPINTPGLDSVASTDAKDYLAASTALQRLGSPDEIANTVLFLASENASYIVGTEVLVDGGFTNYARK